MHYVLNFHQVDLLKAGTHPRAHASRLLPWPWLAINSLSCFCSMISGRGFVFDGGHRHHRGWGRLKRGCAQLGLDLTRGTNENEKKFLSNEILFMWKNKFLFRLLAMWYFVGSRVNHFLLKMPKILVTISISVWSYLEKVSRPNYEFVSSPVFAQGTF